MEEKMTIMRQWLNNNDAEAEVTKPVKRLELICH